MKRERLARMALALAIGTVMAAVIAWMTILHDRQQATGLPAKLAVGGIGGPFTLTAHDGRVVSDQDFRGKYMLVLFGYTYCPDICPTELQTIAQAMDQMGDSGADVQPLFITIDPARDTAPVLADYVKLFHPAVIGLTGTEPQIAAVANAYHVYYARAQTDPDPSRYLMDHSTFSYLLAPDGSFLTVFAKDTTPEQMVAAIRAHRSKAG